MSVNIWAQVGAVTYNLPLETLLGTANQLLGMNAGATAGQWKSATFDNVANILAIPDTGMYGFIGDTDTGVGHVAANKLGLYTGGVLRAAIDVTDGLRLQSGVALQLEDALVKEDLGADIAAINGTTDFGVADGNFLALTNAAGAKVITSLGGATLPAGTEIETTVTLLGGSIQITHNAVSLILLGGVDLTLQNGDVLRWRKINDASAFWMMTGFQRGVSTSSFVNKGDWQLGIGGGNTLMLSVGPNGASPIADVLQVTGVKWFPAQADIGMTATDTDFFTAKQVTATGAAVILTDAVDAPFIGAIAIAIMNAAHTWTNNATFSVMGNANYTCAVDDVVLLIATSLSTFKIIIFPASGASVAGTTKSGAVPLQFLKWGALNLDQNSTRFADGLGLGENATEASVQYIVLEKCTIKQLYASCNAAIPAGQSCVITLRKTGVDTALTCTIPAAGQTAEDTVNEITFYPGDKVSLKLVSSATMTSTIDFTFTVLCIKFGTTVEEGASLVPTWNFAQTYQGEGSTTNTLSEAEAPSPDALCEGPTGVQWDGAASNLTNNVMREGAATFFDFHKALPGFAQGNRFAIANGIVRCAPARWRAYNPVTQYDPCLMYFSSGNHAQNTTLFAGGWLNTGTATESTIQLRIGKACSFKNLQVYSDSAVAAVTTTVEIFKNGVATGVIATLTPASRYAADLVNAITFAAGDKLSIQVISGATTGTRDYNISIEPFNV